MNRGKRLPINQIEFEMKPERSKVFSRMNSFTLLPSRCLAAFEAVPR